jgi:hypothetical protein
MMKLFRDKDRLYWYKGENGDYIGPFRFRYLAVADIETPDYKIKLPNALQELKEFDEYYDRNNYEN